MSRPSTRARSAEDSWNNSTTFTQLRVTSRHERDTTWPLRQEFRTGLSNQIAIESYLVIESNFFAQIELNCIKNESGHFPNFEQKSEQQNTLDVTVRSLKIFTKQNHKRFSQFSDLLVDNTFKELPISHIPAFFHVTSDVLCIKSNRFWIELISNRIKRFLHLPNQKSNPIETNLIWQPWFESKQSFKVCPMKASVMCISQAVN